MNARATKVNRFTGITAWIYRPSYIRAVFRNIISGNATARGSTITQQLA
ncbi:MAG: hypothetical protein ACLVHE_07140 [Dialister invisus]